MTLYVPPLFAQRESAAVSRLIHDYPFATLMTPATPEPLLSHIPLLAVGGGDHGTLIGHFARANAHWQHASGVESIAVFQGPHAYVSPSWYRDSVQAVPTWNFTAVHVHGTLEIIDEPHGALDVLNALVERFEGKRTAPWKMTMPDRQRDALVSAIVAFRMPITRVEAKFKLSQNRASDDRIRVIAALKAEGYADASATAAWMQAYAAPD